MLEWFGVRILPIGPEVADYWGRLLAATALHHYLRLVTRNSGDFDSYGTGETRRKTGVRLAPQGSLVDTAAVRLPTH